jgi:8-amino-3,8-dideoxy-alpha-D-manno-octulosonate transaminase
MLESTPGLGFRKLNDAEGDAGPFLIVFLENETRALAAAEKMREIGLHNIFRVADYGLHIYYNIPSLVDKVALSPAGNPWSLQENADSKYDYHKGSCPQSDAIFARSILVPIPSKLTTEQENFAVETIKAAVSA